MSPQPGVDIAALLTAPIFMCLEATTQTMRRLVGRKTKTTLFLGNFGGSILPQPLGSRSARKATCPPSWRLCQVWTETLLSEFPCSTQPPFSVQNHLLFLKISSLVLKFQRCLVIHDEILTILYKKYLTF